MPDKIEINPETLLYLSRSRVVGGKTTRSETIADDLTGQRRDVEIKTEVVIDNVAERKGAEALVSRATHAIRKVTSATLIGHLGPADVLPVVEAELDEIRADATRFNAEASTCHVEIGLIPVKIAVALGAEAIRAIASEVQAKLSSVRDALKAGDSAKVRNTIREAKNLHTLAVGPIADAIAFGLDEARERASELKERTREHNGVSETGESVGRTLDLSMLESAIAMLTYNPATHTGGTLALVA
jgi:hypothetical protein